MKIVFPELSYSDSLQITGLELLCTRRERLVCNLFCKIKNKGHVLNHVLPANIFGECSYDTRDSYPYRMPRARTERPLRSFISYCVRKRLQYYLVLKLRFFVRCQALVRLCVANVCDASMRVSFQPQGCRRLAFIKLFFFFLYVRYFGDRYQINLLAIVGSSVQTVSGESTGNIISHEIP